VTFSIAQLMERRQSEQYVLHRRYINRNLARVLDKWCVSKVSADSRGVCQCALRSCSVKKDKQMTIP
jgi:hypothetical protein